MLCLRVLVQAIYASVISSRANITLMYQSLAEGGQVTWHPMGHQA